MAWTYPTSREYISTPNICEVPKAFSSQQGPGAKTPSSNHHLSDSLFWDHFLRSRSSLGKCWEATKNTLCIMIKENKGIPSWSRGWDSAFSLPRALKAQVQSPVKQLKSHKPETWPCKHSYQSSSLNTFLEPGLSTLLSLHTFFSSISHIKMLSKRGKKTSVYDGTKSTWAFHETIDSSVVFKSQEIRFVSADYVPCY